MKITMYELLKLIKENKDLPKKIKYGNDVYVLQENPEDYATWLNDNLDLLNDVILEHFNIEDAIYLELEILEEEKKIPEKLDYCEENTFMNKKETTYLSSEERRLLDSNFKELGNKINSIIDYLKSKGE